MGLNPRSWSVFAPRFDRDGAEPADLVVANATIVTCDDSNPRAQAVAVKDGRIAYVGKDRGAARHVGENTRVINGRGRVLTPGFVDNHCHVLWIGGLTGLMTTDLFFCESADEMKEVVLRQAAEHPDSKIVLAQGWKQHCLPQDVPELELLDSWMPDRPVALMSYMATGWVNSRMLDLMRERNPRAFELLVPEKDENGAYNGLLRHFHAFNPLDFVTIEELGEGAKQKFFDAMTRTMDLALSVGVTTMDDVQVYKPYVPIILEFRDGGGLDRARARCGYYVPNDVLDDEEAFRRDLDWWKELGRTGSDEHLVLGKSVKFYIDGVASNHASLWFEPFNDRPDSCGDAVWTQEAFDRVVEIVHTMGMQVCTHCCGDAGINRVINSYERAYRLHGGEDARHRADHCSNPTAEDIERMSRLGIYAVMQPTHFFGDVTVERALGPERLRRFQPWRSIQNAGVELSFGSDWCAGPINPIYGLMVAGTRMNYKFKWDWGPEQRIGVEDAIKHWTIGSARALKMEDDIGSIEEGKYGDMVLFNTNPLKVATLPFLLTHKLSLGAMDGFVDMTFVGGETVYERPGGKEARR
ncbi:MAG: amidohydrolase [Actinobacteria bacterium]|nr:amidohydrolase [Actinomycetota bacterium]MBU1945146.1 amidohydrolase [Actinomycetota bacterium]MBU2686404.1 amidohydrolase [Actinomycetota bacterium]